MYNDYTILMLYYLQIVFDLEKITSASYTNTMLIYYTGIRYVGVQ